VAWAFTATRKQNPQLFETILANATPRLNEFNEQNSTNFIWALARNGLPASGALLRRVEVGTDG